MECFFNSYLCFTKLNWLKCHLVWRMLGCSFALVPEWQSLAYLKKAGFSIFRGVRAGIAVTSLAIAAGSALILGPEYLRVSTPSVGTCWAKSDEKEFKPIACWASDAILKTIAYSNSESNCPTNTDWIFPPDSTDTRYFCLEEIN